VVKQFSGLFLVACTFETGWDKWAWDLHVSLYYFSLRDVSWT